MPGLPQKVHGLQLSFFMLLVELKQVVAGNQFLLEHFDVGLELLKFFVFQLQLTSYRNIENYIFVLILGLKFLNPQKGRFEFRTLT
jgi:hypothetical protein